MDLVPAGTLSGLDGTGVNLAGLDFVVHLVEELKVPASRLLVEGFHLAVLKALVMEAWTELVSTLVVELVQVQLHLVVPGSRRQVNSAALEVAAVALVLEDRVALVPAADQGLFSAGAGRLADDAPPLPSGLNCNAGA